MKELRQDALDGEKVTMQLGNTLVYVVPPRDRSEEHVKKTLSEVEKALWVIVEEIRQRNSTKKK